MDKLSLEASESHGTLKGEASNDVPRSPLCIGEAGMSGSARILVIDDDESIRRALSQTLESAGYALDTAENGKEAIEKSRANFYHLAIIDIRLPDMEGTELLASLQETTPKMVKIILTGYPSLENAAKAINTGVDAYLIKPVKTEELLKLVKEHLEKQKQEKEYNQDKAAQFLETRLKQLQTEELVPPKATKKN
jgi:DNA-binding NtrC family response regulator